MPNYFQQMARPILNDILGRPIGQMRTSELYILQNMMIP